MATYTTFFVCDPAELAPMFPGWQPPLDRPVRREFRNPFTGQLSIIESREPEWPDADDAAPPRAVAVAIPGRYEDYLEQRLAPSVRARPHWATKGLTRVELAPLLDAAGLRASWEPPLYAPPAASALLEALPERFCETMPTLDEHDLARRWAEAMSAPERTHSVTGQKISDGWTVAQGLAALRAIVGLVRCGAPNERMYLLIEF